jgi:hypothetical protein
MIAKIFLLVLIWLDLYLPQMQKLLSWFLDFSQKELFHVKLLNWSIQGQRVWSFRSGDIRKIAE